MRVITSPKHSKKTTFTHKYTFLFVLECFCLVCVHVHMLFLPCNSSVVYIYTVCTVCRRGKGPKGKGKSAYLERLRSGSCENLPPCKPGRAPSRQMSTPAEIQALPMTPNSSRQQSDLDLTTPGERRGQSTSTLSP